MATDFLPSRDGDLALWAANFNSLVTATPTAFGLTSGQATTLATANTAFQTALSTATNPATRTKVTVAAKNTAKANLVALVRQYAQIVQGYPPVTDAQLESLGLTVRSTGRTPVPPPTTFPLVSFISTMSTVATLAIADELTPNARKRPFGTIGAEIWVKLGTAPPVALSECTFLGLATRFPARFTLEPAAVGKTAYVWARWVNRKSQPGPLSSIASAVISN